MPTVVHVFLASCQHQSRLLREIRATHEAGLARTVLVEAMAENELPAYEAIGDCAVIWRVPIVSRGLNRSLYAQALKYFEWAIRCVVALRGRQIDLVHAHSLPALPPALALKALTGAGVVYDAHELETEQASTGVRKYAARAVERVLVEIADEMMVVGDQIAEWYVDHYGIRRPTVLRNLPEHRVNPGATIDLKGRLGIPSDDLLYIYLGGIDPGRGVERLVRVFAQAVPGRHLLFLGSGTLEPLVVEATKRFQNIHHLPPVPAEQVVNAAAGADAGISLIEAVCLSNYLSLPNKMFEYWGAGIPAILSDLPEQSALLRQFDAGWTVGEGDQEVVSLVNRLSHSELAARAVRARTAATELCWDTEKRALLHVYRRVLEKRASSLGQRSAARGSSGLA